MNVDSFSGLVKQYTVIADAQPEQSVEIAFEGLNVAMAGLGVTVETGEDAHCGLLIDGSQIDPGVRGEANFLHSL